MTQTDVLEGGRATIDLLMRELEQAAPSSRGNVFNYFCEEIPNVTPLTQPLPGSKAPAVNRMNTLEDLFFLTRTTQTWIGNGYCVRTSDGVRLGLP